MNLLYDISYEVPIHILAAWGDFLIRATLIMVVALVFAEVVKHASATVRHYMLMLSVALIPVVLALSLQAYPKPLATWDYPMTIMQSSYGPSPSVLDPNPAAESENSLSQSGTGKSIPWLDAYSEESHQPHWQVREVFGLLFVIWIVGMVGCIFKLMIRLIALHRYGRRLRSISAHVLTPALATACQRLKIRRVPRLLIGDTNSFPMTWGFLRHTIALPPEAEQWSESRIQSVLLHELSHIRRSDFLLSVLHRIFLIPLWFHPLAWLVGRQLSLTRELACDDAVIEHVNARTFADELLSVATGTRLAASGLAIGIGPHRKSSLQRRIRALFSDVSHQVKVRFSERLTCLSVCGVIGLLTFIAGCQTSSMLTVEPSGPLQERYQGFSPRTSSQTFVKSTIPEEGPRLRFAISEFSLSVTDRSRAFIDRLPMPPREGPASPMVAAGDRWIQNDPLFTKHVALTAKETEELLKVNERILDSSISPFFGTELLHEPPSTETAPENRQSISYHSPREFYLAPTPADPHTTFPSGVRFYPFDPNEKPIEDPFLGLIDIDVSDLGEYLNVSGKILEDGRTIALSFDRRRRSLGGFRYSEDQNRELPVFIEGHYEAHVQVEDGGLLLLPTELSESYSMKKYPVVGSLFSKKRTYQSYRAFAVKVDIVSE